MQQTKSPRQQKEAIKFIQQMIQPEVVWSEALPKRKESFVLHDLDDDVDGAAIFGFPVDNLHVLNSDRTNKPIMFN